MTTLLTALALLGAALAQDATTLTEPLPIAGQPWSALVTAFALPPQKAAFITTDAALHVCELTLTLQPSGAFEAVVGRCPEPMAPAALEAARQWRFAPASVDLAVGPTKMGLAFVMQYSEVLGATTLHAELDPGGANTALQGAPGVQLVHRAAMTRSLDVKLSKKQIKAGVTPTECRFAVDVSAIAKVTSTRALACPEPLLADAVKRLNNARWLPRTVDGVPYEDAVEASVNYISP